MFYKRTKFFKVESEMKKRIDVNCPDDQVYIMPKTQDKGSPLSPFLPEQRERLLEMSKEGAEIGDELKTRTYFTDLFPFIELDIEDGSKKCLFQRNQVVDKSFVCNRHGVGTGGEFDPNGNCYIANETTQDVKDCPICQNAGKSLQIP